MLDFFECFHPVSSFFEMTKTMILENFPQNNTVYLHIIGNENACIGDNVLAEGINLDHTVKLYPMFLNKLLLFLSGNQWYMPMYTLRIMG